jgi:hypothetical protein
MSIFCCENKSQLFSTIRQSADSEFVAKVEFNFVSNSKFCSEILK